MTAKSDQEQRYWLTAAGYAALEEIERQNGQEDDRGQA